MKIHILPPSKWSHKHIILVTLVGTLIATAIVAVISISLSPGHIYLSIADATSGKLVEGNESTQYYNFTLVASNSSPRMAVLYGALDAEVWYSETAWVPAVVEMGERRQAPGNVTHINVSAEYWQSEQASSDEANKAPPSPPSATDNSTTNSTTNANWSNCTVVVIAKVWFEAGGISTRSYNIRASCSQVNFSNATAIVDCTHG
ncbi:unnamed protein product [Alopecurus aequalis]